MIKKSRLESNIISIAVVLLIAVGIIAYCIAVRKRALTVKVYEVIKQTRSFDEKDTTIIITDQGKFKIISEADDPMVQKAYDRLSTPMLLEMRGKMKLKTIIKVEGMHITGLDIEQSRKKYGVDPFASDKNNLSKSNFDFSEALNEQRHKIVKDPAGQEYPRIKVVKDPAGKMYPGTEEFPTGKKIQTNKYPTGTRLKYDLAPTTPKPKVEYDLDPTTPKKETRIEYDPTTPKKEK